MIEPYSAEVGVIISGTYDGYHFVLFNNGTCPVGYVQFPHSDLPDDGLKAFMSSDEVLDLCELFVPVGNKPGMIPQYSYAGTMFPKKDGETIDDMMGKIKAIAAAIKKRPQINPHFI